MTAKENADYLMKYAQDQGVTDPRELANFMGQMQVECGGFTRMDESLSYSPENLLKTFPGRNGMNTLDDARRIVAGGREAVVDEMYGGDWGKYNLGNTEPGDAMRFHGRGFVQLTGRANYQKIGDALGIDLVDHPELASERETAAKIAVYYWEHNVQKNGHQTDVTGACHDINNGEKGLPERKVAAREWGELLDRGYQPGGTDPIPFLNGRAPNENVRHAQELLNQAGYRDANGNPLQEDGVMGKQTKAVVEAFQKDHGLTVDGVVGPDTLRALGAQPGTPPKEPSAPSPSEANTKPSATGAMREGDTGDNVKSLQETLSRLGYTDEQGKPLTADGKYGAHTKEAVERYQREHGLTVDGVAGKDTLNALRQPDGKTPSLNDDTHPAHGLFNQAQDAVRHLDREHGRPFDEQSLRLAGAATAEASRQGMTGIDRIVVNADASMAYAVKGDLDSPHKQVAEVNMQAALATPLEKSGEAALQAQATLANAQSQQQQQQQPQRMA